MEGIELLWDVAVELHDAAGLAAVADVLARAGINVDSVCLVRGPAPLTCHLLAADGANAADALARAGTPASTREVLVCVLQNRPGTLAAVSAALNVAGVTVDLLYQATDRGLVIGADDLAAARDAVVASGRLAARAGPTLPP
ncbi:MAG: amino acid-binding protein [Candidatus Aeolococcus gillhamiae]|uniref:Amino acid-binding protein n=2 Tax=Candidatus Aeolococcus gillhamiae TaxID=3127015 RepID=A0A2W6AUL4_9BACT|nr:MAG: amino acid-binding protein [Candidatus Dormibacter sp. RRmetagenome_bin12]